MIIKNERKRYASDLTDGQWKIIKPLLPKAGNKSKWEKRELINAVLYLLENGSKWRNLAHNFSPHTTVSNFYYAAVKSGLWEKLLAALVRCTREKAGRKAEPSYGIIDSQSVKTAGRAENKGIDGEKTKGRKRHIVVDIIGNLLSVVVHAANIHDTKSGIFAAKKRYKNIHLSNAFVLMQVIATVLRKM